MQTLVEGLPNCPHCGGIHDGICRRIKAIEYHDNGEIKRIEYKGDELPHRGGYPVYRPIPQGPAPDPLIGWQVTNCLGSSDTETR